MNQEIAILEVVRHRGKGWVVQAIQDTPIPESLPYAHDSQAWAIALMKQWNELGDEPFWLKGTDQETHQMYYAEMGEAARTVSRVECDLVIWSQGQFFIVPTQAHKTEPQETLSVTISFSIEFPAELSKV